MTTAATSSPLPQDTEGYNIPPQTVFQKALEEARIISGGGGGGEEAQTQFISKEQLVHDPAHHPQSSSQSKKVPRIREVDLLLAEGVGAQSLDNLKKASKASSPYESPTDAPILPAPLNTEKPKEKKVTLQDAFCLLLNKNYELLLPSQQQEIDLLTSKILSGKLFAKDFRYLNSTLSAIVKKEIDTILGTPNNSISALIAPKLAKLNAETGGIFGALEKKAAKTLQNQGPSDSSASAKRATTPPPKAKTTPKAPLDEQETIIFQTICSILPGEVQNALCKLLGRDYTALSPSQQKEIDSIVSKLTTRSLSEKDFRYLNGYNTAGIKRKLDVIIGTKENTISALLAPKLAALNAKTGTGIFTALNNPMDNYHATRSPDSIPTQTDFKISHNLLSTDTFDIKTSFTALLGKSVTQLTQEENDLLKNLTEQMAKGNQKDWLDSFEAPTIKARLIQALGTSPIAPQLAATIATNYAALNTKIYLALYESSDVEEIKRCLKTALHITCMKTATPIFHENIVLSGIHAMSVMLAIVSDLRNRIAQIDRTTLERTAKAKCALSKTMMEQSVRIQKLAFAQAQKAATQAHENLEAKRKAEKLSTIFKILSPILAVVAIAITALTMQPGAMMAFVICMTIATSGLQIADQWTGFISNKFSNDATGAAYKFAIFAGAALVSGGAGFAVTMAKTSAEMTKELAIQLIQAVLLAMIESSASSGLLTKGFEELALSCGASDKDAMIVSIVLTVVVVLIASIKLSPSTKKASDALKIEEEAVSSADEIALTAEEGGKAAGKGAAGQIGEQAGTATQLASMQQATLQAQATAGTAAEQVTGTIQTASSAVKTGSKTGVAAESAATVVGQSRTSTATQSLQIAEEAADVTKTTTTSTSTTTTTTTKATTQMTNPNIVVTPQTSTSSSAISTTTRPRSTSITGPDEATRWEQMAAKLKSLLSKIKYTLGGVQEGLQVSKSIAEYQTKMAEAEYLRQQASFKTAKSETDALMMKLQAALLAMTKAEKEKNKELQELVESIQAFYDEFEDVIKDLMKDVKKVIKAGRGAA